LKILNKITKTFLNMFVLNKFDIRIPLLLVCLVHKIIDQMTKSFQDYSDTVLKKDPIFEVILK